MQLYGLKTCDTCRKARKALDQARFIDVRDEGVPLDTLKAAYARFSGSLLNTRSTTWRGLADAERSRDPIDLLQEYPSLMKRPLIVAGDDMFLGWDGVTQVALGIS